MKYIVYLTKNLKATIDGLNRVLIGVHKTDNPEIFDGYIGDGVYVNRNSSFMYPKTPFQYAVKKYGTEAFERTTLFIYDNKFDAYAKEKELVDEKFIKMSHTYNAKLGGKPSVKSVYQYTTKGEFKKKWNSLIDIANFFGMSLRRFENAIKGCYPLVDFIWSYKSSINPEDINKHPKVLHVYDKKGKWVNEYASYKECALVLNSTEEVIKKSIYNQHLIGDYYVSDKLVDLFIPKPRRQYLKETFYVYTEDGSFVGKFFGKEVMKAINLHSWRKISNIFNVNHNWYKNFYITLEKIDTVPAKRLKEINIEIFDKFGNLKDTLHTVAEFKEKYGVTNKQVKDIQKGNKFFKEFIVKYSSK